MNSKLNFAKGFTMLELLIVMGIMAVLGAIILSTFVNFRKNQALQKDTEAVVELLNQARNQTISSKNLSAYGVHFDSTSIVLFIGPTFDPSSITNQVITLNSTDTILSVTLNGGGNDVIFNRISGETDHTGTVVVSSPGLLKSKTVTIYNTGVVESQ